MLGECQVNIKSQSELDISGRETCNNLSVIVMKSLKLSNLFEFRCLHSLFQPCSNFQLPSLHKGCDLEVSESVKDRTMTRM